VNKVDNDRRIPDAAEFIRLGLGDPVLISALGGIGIGDLLSKIVGNLEPYETDEAAGTAEGLRLAVVGRPNVGKSTFVNTVLGRERVLVTEIPGTTRDAVDVRIRFGDHDFILIDTAGMRRRSRVKESVEYYSALRTHRALERCDVACVFVDASEGMTQQDMRVVREVTEARKGVVIAVNKWDTIMEDPYRVHWFEEEIRYKLQGLTFIPVITISCTQELRVEEVLQTAYDVFVEREKRIASPELNRLLKKIGESHPPPAVQGKRVRILYGAQIGTSPPRFVFFSKFPEFIKASYQRFIENRLRDQFGFEGVPLVLSFRKKK
jgi:GTP-binding protein